MKRKLAVLVCGLVLIAVVAYFGMLLNGAKEMARQDALELGVRHLAGAIELYREEHKRYPLSMDELLLGMKPELKAEMERYRILNNAFDDRYEYRPLTNGFVIIVTAPDRWFRKGERVERRYKIGEALR